jgi:hypothetical protein
MFREKLLDCFSGGINTLQGAFLNSVAKFANRNYLGTLVNEKEYKFITYKETQVLATKLASG